MRHIAVCRLVQLCLAFGVACFGVLECWLAVHAGLCLDLATVARLAVRVALCMDLAALQRLAVHAAWCLDLATVAIGLLASAVAGYNPEHVLYGIVF
jgi:hypothetical protein